MIYHLVTDADNNACANKIACSATGWRETHQCTFFIEAVTCSACKATKEYQEGCIAIDSDESKHTYNPWIIYSLKQGRMLVFKRVIPEIVSQLI